MSKHDEDSGYYEDDGEFLEDELPSAVALRHRLVAVFTTSYGLSIAAHVGLLLILATIIIASPPKKKEAKVTVNPVVKPRIPDPEAERAMELSEDIPIPEVDEPVVNFDDDVDVPDPKGVDEALSSKQTAKDAISFDDVLGLSGASAGSKGRRDGIGDHGKTGGGKKTEPAVDAALRWLAAHQSPDGCWDADGWRSNCSRGPTCSGPGTENGGSNYDVGVTSLALLAFMGHGNTSRSGRFKRVVRKGLRWIKSQQRADGSLGFEPGKHSTIYNHALATLALCEGYGIGRDFTFRDSAQRAVDLLVAAQNPGLGWRYGVRTGRNDTSVTGWVVLALKAAHSAKLDVPRTAFAGALKWFKRATSTSGDVGYTSPGGGSAMLPENESRYDPVPTLTAVSVVCRIFSGDSRRSDDTLRRGARIVGSALPEWKDRRINFYYWYYGTYAMYHFDGKKWDAWNAAMIEALVPHQRKGRVCEDGSWDPVGEWCLAGGRVYATAINVLTLEIYYRYKRQSHASTPPRPSKARKG
jgi:hypothetical protein